ncbi:phage tail tip lysozyme [Phaeobacter sp. PT47_59]|uniref:phage tail tip lysozyme n=1 Tax=Phaeobacter sp. PT47_59 TaxID=3029979 RepID=UPI0023800BA3|nr:phage tail tip lysozyme [Phaeobacter sp. PT47_59]MDE4176359.1 phage tail tip lysozyme [Phaeobacter sp. PT47_59]
MRDMIYQGLRARGLPDHIARGFLANFQVESGLNPGINEIAPLVPGSRGGFGLAQWTGPRRRQFEAFAGERGTRVDDLDTQLDFLMHELGTTEQSAAKSIFAAQTPEDATRAISEKFLRPGIPHLDRRLAALNGGGGTPGFMAGGEGNDRLGAPMQQDQEQRGAFGIKPELAMALAGAFFNASRPGSGNQFLQNAYAMRARGERDAKTTKARNQTAEWLRGNGYGEFADLVEGGAVAAGDVMGAIMQQRLAAPKDNRTAALREYEFAKTQGYEGTFIDYQQAKQAGAGGTEYGLNPQYGVDESGNPVILQLGKDGTAAQTALPEGVTFQKEPIKLDGGTEWILLDPISRQVIGSIPKNLEEAAADTARGRELGKAEGENAAAAGADYQKAQAALDLIDNIRNDPNRVRATGKSAMLNAIPGTGGYDFERKVEQAKGGAFLAAIDAMRGMGALSDAEGQAARQAITRMDTAMTEQGFLDALDDYEAIVKQALSSAAQRGGGPASVDAGGGQGAGAPATGEVVDGYQFLGGDPSDPSRWSKVTR